MRKYGFDELPQLKSVVKGDISLVGPRVADERMFRIIKNHRPQAVTVYSENYFEAPGAIGIQQARAINSKDDRKRLKYDRFYAKKASFGLDQTILITAAVRRLHGVFERKKAKHDKAL